MKKFNIRCYAIIINDDNEILLSDEFLGEHYFTKFIGGGLEFGEGTKDCIVREIKEEIDLEASVDELFYVNDFFQESAFNSNEFLGFQSASKSMILAFFAQVLAGNWKQVSNTAMCNLGCNL